MVTCDLSCAAAEEIIAVKSLLNILCVTARWMLVSLCSMHSSLFPTQINFWYWQKDVYLLDHSQSLEWEWHMAFRNFDLCSGVQESGILLALLLALVHLLDLRWSRFDNRISRKYRLYRLTLIDFPDILSFIICICIGAEQSERAIWGINCLRLL
jgi:hypothetical protein